MKTGMWTAAAGAAAALGLSIALALPLIGSAQTAPNGEALYNARCKTCHEPAVERAPGRQALGQLAHADLVQAMTSGPMAPMAAGLTPAEIQAIATFLRPAPAPAPAAAQTGRGGAAAAAPGRGGRGVAAGPPFAATMQDRLCSAHPPIRATNSDWTSFLLQPTGQRFQPNPGLSAADVRKLKVRWAFSLPGGSYGSPAVVGDWLFITSRGGQFYALDADTGCVHWRNDGVPSRATPIVAQADISPSGWVIYTAERDRTVRAWDAQTGKQLWKSPVIESHPVAGITGPPTLHNGQLFVPITSGEESAAGAPTYRCCSFRGSVAALDARTGQIQWKTYAIREPLRDLRPNSAGTMMQGPAGAAIWSAPTVDPGRGVIYVATGDSYTEAATEGADAIQAIDMKTGAVKWNTQVLANDNFIVGCTTPRRPVNCPSNDGPDFDFGAAPLLFDLGGGKQVVVSGNKSGLVFGMDPDTGKTLWATRVGSGSAQGGVMWGIASDGRYVFAPNADTMSINDAVLRPKGEHTWNISDPPPARPSVTAIDPANGRIAWQTPTPKAPCKLYGDRTGRDKIPGFCVNAQSQAVSAMPGVVFGGSLDGWFRAYDARTGRVLWAFSTTAQLYDTTNNVKGQPGGSMDGLGATIAGGKVYTMSGFNGSSNTGGNGTNVLLAFSVDGK